MGWDRAGNRHERGYGAAWVRVRRIAMDRDKHLCQPCLANGRYTPATEVDHITPKTDGGNDDLSNLQSICRACHADKSAAEGAAGRQARRDGDGFRIPDMKPSAVPVIVIAGAPGSGKTTYARSISRDGDMILDLDDLIEAISGRRWSTDPAIVGRALDARNRELNALHAKRSGRCILVMTAPSPAERMAWMKRLGMRARLKVMHASADECARRIAADPARAHVAAQQISAARAWR